MSPFAHIIHDKGFNSTENTRTRSAHIHDNEFSPNVFTNQCEQFMLGDTAKIADLENRLKEKNSEIQELRRQLEKTETLLSNAAKNFEGLKSSYISMSAEKDAAVRDFQVLKNSDVHRKLKATQDRVFCLERDLELTNDKLKTKCKTKCATITLDMQSIFSYFRWFK